MRIQRNKRRFSRSWWLHIRTTSARISISAATTLASRISTRPSFITRKPPNSHPTTPPPSDLKLVAAYPNDERAHFNLGGYYFGQQDFNQAIVHYKKATELAPDYSTAFNILGYA